MAKRNRYREMESLMTKIILGDVAVFVLYLVFAGLGMSVFKVITAIVALLGSFLCVAWLYWTRELTKRRSLWMTTIFVCIIVCMVMSLILNYPCPMPKA